MLAPQVVLFKDGIKRLGCLYVFMAHHIGQACQVPTGHRVLSGGGSLDHEARETARRAEGTRLGGRWVPYNQPVWLARSRLNCQGGPGQP